MFLDKGLDLILSWPPSINNYYGKAKHGTYIKREGLDYRKSVVLDMQEQLGSWEPLTQRVLVVVTWHPPDNRVRDIDNYLKCLFDAISKAGVWTDDRLVKQMVVLMGEVKREGYVDVYLEPAMPLVPCGVSSREIWDQLK